MTIIMDTETTDLVKPTFVKAEEQPRIVDFAAILIHPVSGEIIETIDSIVNPECDYREDLSKMTGITREMLLAAPKFVELIPRIRDMFYMAAQLVGHNVLFDQGMLKYELLRAECDYFPWPTTTICTVQEYRHLFGYRPNLKQLHDRICGGDLVWEHRALGDVMALYRILKKEGWWG